LTLIIRNSYSATQPFPPPCWNGIYFQKNSPQKFLQNPFPLRCGNKIIFQKKITSKTKFSFNTIHFIPQRLNSTLSPDIKNDALMSLQGQCSVLWQEWRVAVLLFLFATTTTVNRHTELNVRSPGFKCSPLPLIARPPNPADIDTQCR
jgi:hypothetical protein